MIPGRIANKGCVRHQNLAAYSPCVQPLGRNDVVKGPDGDAQHPGSGFSVIQEPGFHESKPFAFLDLREQMRKLLNIIGKQREPMIFHNCSCMKIKGLQRSLRGPVRRFHPTPYVAWAAMTYMHRRTAHLSITHLPFSYSLLPLRGDRIRPSVSGGRILSSLSYVKGIISKA